MLGGTNPKFGLLEPKLERIISPWFNVVITLKAIFSF